MKPIFRNAMFGFNKEDVFNFMTKQNKQYDSKVAELTAQLDKQSAEFERERESFDRDKSEMEALQNAVSASRELLSRISEIAFQISNDKSRITACAETISQEKANDEKRLCEMQARVNEAEKLREKAEKFDQLSGVLSSIFNQPEMVSSSPDLISDPISSCEEREVGAVTELSDLVAVLSAHCDKLSILLSSANENS